MMRRQTVPRAGQDVRSGKSDRYGGNLYKNSAPEVSGRREVEKIGLEPTTSCMPCKRSSQLSYIPVCKGKYSDLFDVCGVSPRFFSRIYRMRPLRIPFFRGRKAQGAPVVLPE